MPETQRRNTFLILSQVYIPDPASVGQHVADAAAEMARRGYRVIVYAANRGYEDPTQRYPSREVIDGVEIRRFPLSSFGKQSIALRLLAGTIFMLQCMIRGLFVRDLYGILVSTSPPMCSVAAMFIGALRRAPIKYWVMDLNPDQMVALGKLTPTSLPVRVFDALNRAILRHAADVVALDRFMADSLHRKRDIRDKLSILPPWPHEDHLGVVSHDQNPFRQKHGLAGKLVIMNSGNHGTSTPIDTVMQAAVRLRDRDDIVFMFIGGGVRKKQDVDDVIARHGLTNVRSLPYQPLSEIKYSLSAADVHIVSVADNMVGIIHPCKVYGAMTVARPILLLGPDPCHVGDLVSGNGIGWHVRHGDVDGAVRAIEEIAGTPAEARQAMGARARELILAGYSKSALCGAFCDVLERGLTKRRRHAADRPATSGVPLDTPRGDVKIARPEPQAAERELKPADANA